MIILPSGWCWQKTLVFLPNWRRLVDASHPGTLPTGSSPGFVYFKVSQKQYHFIVLLLTMNGIKLIKSLEWNNWWAYWASGLWLWVLSWKLWVCSHSFISMTILFCDFFLCIIYTMRHRCLCFGIDFLIWLNICMTYKYLFRSLSVFYV